MKSDMKITHILLGILAILFLVKIGEKNIEAQAVDKNLYSSAAVRALNNKYVYLRSMRAYCNGNKYDNFYWQAGLYPNYARQFQIKSPGENGVANTVSFYLSGNYYGGARRYYKSQFQNYLLRPLDWKKYGSGCNWPKGTRVRADQPSSSSKAAKDAATWYICKSASGKGSGKYGAFRLKPYGCRDSVTPWYLGVELTARSNQSGQCYTNVILRQEGELSDRGAIEWAFYYRPTDSKPMYFNPNICPEGATSNCSRLEKIGGKCAVCDDGWCLTDDKKGCKKRTTIANCKTQKGCKCEMCSNGWRISLGGQKCEKNDAEDCRWSNWGAWTECSEVCGGGYQMRSRENNGRCGEWPNNKQSEKRKCATWACPRGAKGKVGGVGPQGLRGPRGDKGAQGKSGGTTGPVGGSGAQGPQGDLGNRGEIGITGPRGFRGKPGKVIDRGERMKHYLSTIYKKLKILNPQKADKTFIQARIREAKRKEKFRGQMDMKPYNITNYF